MTATTTNPLLPSSFLPSTLTTIPTTPTYPQGVGRVLCALVLVIVAHTMTDYNSMWRIAVICGAVPMIIALYLRWSVTSRRLVVVVVVERDIVLWWW